jgi:uncharacterized protein
MLLLKSTDLPLVVPPNTDLALEIAETLLANLKESRILGCYSADSLNRHERYILGRIWGDGIGVQKDKTKAFRLFGLSANERHPHALCSLAWCYEKGSGTSCNLPQAVKIYQELSNQGHAHAQYNLAWLYHNGCVTGVTVEDGIQTAIELYQKAADQGLAHAQYYLAIYHYNGVGTTRDPMRARELYSLAAKQGFAPAMTNLSLCDQRSEIVDEIQTVPRENLRLPQPSEEGKESERVDASFRPNLRDQPFPGPSS